MAVNFAKLPELLRQQSRGRGSAVAVPAKSQEENPSPEPIRFIDC
jgi:hypothetical protein